MAGLVQDVADVFEPPAGIISKSVQILAMNEVDQEIRDVANGFFVPQIELLQRTVGKLMKDGTHRMVGRDSVFHLLDLWQHCAGVAIPHQSHQTLKSVLS